MSKFTSFPYARSRRSRPSIISWLIKFRLLWIIFIAIFFLSGCVRYDVALTFKDSNHGTIIQHIRIDRSSKSLGDTVITAWLDSFEQRAKRLGGSTRHLAKHELLITIPFHNTVDLVEKFNVFFQPDGSVETFTAKAASEFDSYLRVRTNNALLWERNRLQYDLDLRSLNSLLPPGVDLDLNDLLKIEFRLKTPWGARSLSAVEVADPIVTQHGRQLVWQLQPGTVNHLDLMFWVPSPLGMGVVAIALFTTIGIVLKYRLDQGRAAIASLGDQIGSQE
jgi:hypothetical protein